MEHKVNKRYNFVPLTEPHRVALTFPYIVYLKEIPDLAATITIPNMVRIYTMPQASTEFFVNRNGDVYFHEAKKDSPVTISYYGGGSRLNADDWNEMIDVLGVTNGRITDLTSLIFGNIKLKVTPTSIATAVGSLNTSSSHAWRKTFTAQLTNMNNAVYTWLTDVQLYLQIRKSFVDSDIIAPVLKTPLNAVDLKFINGVCQFTVEYDTDYGAYKKYTAGDYVSYGISTVDPNSMVGLNLSVTVVDAIQ
jgi:hypothetical protein